jgi:hypothetical protein
MNERNTLLGIWLHLHMGLGWGGFRHQKKSEESRRGQPTARKGHGKMAVG